MKTVLITGASRGIGRATALKFAQGGYGVGINYNNSKKDAEGLKKEIESFGGKAEIFKADISDSGQTAKMIREAGEKLGSLDVLVNNAGIALPQGLFTDFDDSDIKRIFDTNVIGMMNCTKGVIPQMVQKKSGRIINVSSIWGEIGGSCEVIYSASKAAVIGFTKALAKELGPSNIRVNAISCGWIDTDMNAHFSEEDKNAFVDEVPLCRTGKVEDVAKTCLYLASEAASYMTGQILTLDGGLL